VSDRDGDGQPATLGDQVASLVALGDVRLEVVYDSEEWSVRLFLPADLFTSHRSDLGAALESVIKRAT